MRMSDWEHRPLTQAQLHYAAPDAHVLLQIFYKMQEQHLPGTVEGIKGAIILPFLTQDFWTPPRISSNMPTVTAWSTSELTRNSNELVDLSELFSLLPHRLKYVGFDATVCTSASCQLCGDGEEESQVTQVAQLFVA
ncbi:hypothetical protein PsorP6_019084 [Peronosclerospora sorghi]|nr:hypothetical protein PsorP6_019084 [Peronosclerospora sorghi]